MPTFLLGVGNSYCTSRSKETVLSCKTGKQSSDFEKSLHKPPIITRKPDKALTLVTFVGRGQSLIVST